MLFFMGVILILWGTACSKESATENTALVENKVEQSKMELPKTNPTITEGKQGYNPNNPVNSIYLHVENGSKYLLSNVPSTGAAQIYTTILEIVGAGYPDPPPPECYRAAYPICNSIMVSGVPSTAGSMLLTNAIGLAIGNGNFAYITTGSNSGLASNSLFCINLATSTGVFIAKTKTATGSPSPVQDIECVSVNHLEAYGIVNNQLAILNLTTGIYTTKPLPTGVYTGLTVTNDNTIAVFMPNHESGATRGGYRTINNGTWAVSNVINWNGENLNWLGVDGGFTNTPTAGLRHGSSNALFTALTHSGGGYITQVGTCLAPWHSVPVFDYANF